MRTTTIAVLALSLFSLALMRAVTPAWADDEDDPGVAALQAQLQRTQAELTRAQAERTRAQSELQRTQAEIRHLREAFDKLTENATRSQRAVQALTNSLKAMREMNAALQGEVAALRAQLAQAGAPPQAKEVAGTDAAIAELRAAVQSLRADVDTLRAQAARTRLRPKTAPRNPAFAEREAKVRRRRSVGDAQRSRSAAVATQRKTWYDAVRSLREGAPREKALAEMRAALDEDDPARLLAALQLARWLGTVEYDRADFRRGVLPHAKSEDPEVRRAALIALAWVQPEKADLALWADTVKSADRQHAEEIAQALVRTSGGVIRGGTADAVLHLLRDGTQIRKAFVIRGLQSGKEWDPAVEARLIEVVRAASASNYDSAYYFHFITPHLDPKSDAVLELLLDRIAQGKGSIQTIARGFRTGLSDEQKDHAADKLLTYAESASSAYTVRFLAEALEHVARAGHVARLEALIAGDGVDKHARRAVERAVAAAKGRR